MTLWSRPCLSDLVLAVYSLSDLNYTTTLTVTLTLTLTTLTLTRLKSHYGSDRH